MKKDEVTKLAVPIMVALVTSLITVAYFTGGVSARVTVNEEKLSHMVPRSEVESITKWQIKYEDTFDTRMNRLELKLDKLVEIDLQRGIQK